MSRGVSTSITVYGGITPNFPSLLSFKSAPVLGFQLRSFELQTPVEMESLKSPDIKQKSSLYPEVDQSNPVAPLSSPNSSSSSNLYPSISMHDSVDNLFPDPPEAGNEAPSAPPEAKEEVLLRIPGAILNLIDKYYSVELGVGDLTIKRIVQDGNVVAVLAEVADDIQWPLTKDGTAVKVDESHYFFSFRTLKHTRSSSDEDSDEHVKSRSEEQDALSYGLTIVTKGQERLLDQLDQILRDYSCFSEQRVCENAKEKAGEVLDDKLVKEISPAELKGEKKEMVEKKCAAYWTTLAPNVEDYSGKTGRLIASGSGKLIKGILWCGDVTADRIVRGSEVLKKRSSRKEEKKVSPETLKRIRRVKKMTRMTERVAIGVLSGVVKVSGFFTSSVANSKAGKKFFNLLPGEIVLATLDGFNKICDAVEIAGKNVMSTSSTVTTELVDQRYGQKAAEATNEGLEAAGHAIGTAWAAFKIRKALNPKSVLKPSKLAKSAVKAAASEITGKTGSK